MTSTFVPEITIRKEEYDEVWKNKDESTNPRQYHYQDMIEHEQMTDMENELRKIVDEMMRNELMLLQVCNATIFSRIARTQKTRLSKQCVRITGYIRLEMVCW